MWPSWLRRSCPTYWKTRVQLLARVFFSSFFANGVCLNSSDTGDLSEVFDMRLEGDYVAVVTGKLTGGG